MNIPEEIAIALFKNPYGCTDKFSILCINSENYADFRKQVLPWEVVFNNGVLFFMGLRVVIVKDPLNIWRLA